MAGWGRYSSTGRKCLARPQRRPRRVPDGRSDRTAKGIPWLVASNLREAIMKTRYGLAQLFVCAALLFGGYTPTLSQEMQCLQQVQIGVRPRAWEIIKDYFVS